MSALERWLSTRLVFDEGAGIPTDVGPVWAHLVFGATACAVLADIVGPAVGSVGADCGSFFARKCPARMLAIVTMGYADVAKVCAREAQKESDTE